jgi:hypothetical protein
MGLPLWSVAPPMPLRTEAAYLRERAKRLREIAALAPTSALNDQLIGMATDLEERAAELENQQFLIESGVNKDPFVRSG